MHGWACGKKRFAQHRQKQTKEVFASRYSERKGWLLRGASRRLVFVRSGQTGLDALVNLLAMHGNILGCVDADSYLLAADAQDGDVNVITDVYALPDLAGEYRNELFFDYF